MDVKNKIPMITFFCLFSLYLIGLNSDINLFYNNLLFWVPVMGMMVILFYQILSFSSNEYTILVELFLFYLCLHLVYQLGFYGLGSADAYSDYAFFKTILATNHFSLGGEISGWPILHILATEIVELTNFGPLQIAKFLPSFISSMLLLPIYLLAKGVYNNKKVALFACLIFGTIPQFVEFEGYFVREVIAVFFMVLLFYAVYTYKKNPKENRQFLALFLLLVPVLVLSHHFSSFLFLVLLTLFLVMNWLVPLIYKPKNVDLKSRMNLNTIFMICTVALFAYWIYSASLVWENIGIFFKGLFGINDVSSYLQQAQLTGSIVSLRGNLIYYGFFVFNTILGCVLLLKLIIDNNREKIEDSFFTSFLVFCGFYGVMATFFISSSIYPQRLLTFGWIFGVIPLAGFLLTMERMENEVLRVSIKPLKKLKSRPCKIFRVSSERLLNSKNLRTFKVSSESLRSFRVLRALFESLMNLKSLSISNIPFKRLKSKISNYKVLNVVFVVLIFSFMVFNLYNIDPNYIGKDYNAVGVADYKEYAIADTVKFNSSFTDSNTSNIYYGYGGVINAIFDEQGIDPHKWKDVSKIKNYDKNFSKTNKIAIINENIILQYLSYQKVKSIQSYNDNMMILSYKNNSHIDKIGDVGDNIYILMGTG
jgi:hypothetical protein